MNKNITAELASPSNSTSTSCKSALRAERQCNINQIQYFQLDLKGLVNRDQQQRCHYIDKNRLSTAKERLFGQLQSFLKRLPSIQEQQIQQSFSDELMAHLQQLSQRHSSLMALVNLNITNLINKDNQKAIEKNTDKFKHFKRQRALMSEKCEKFSIFNKDRQKKKQPKSSYCKHKIYCDSLELKKIVKTMVDEEGNEFRVTVQKIQ